MIWKATAAATAISVEKLAMAAFQADHLAVFRVAPPEMSSAIGDIGERLRLGLAMLVIPAANAFPVD